MELIIVRHGESLANVEGRMQGRLDSALSERGRAQAETLGKFLSLRGFSWHACYSSPLARARETAEIVARTANGPQPQFEDDLAEVHAGELEGLTRDEIAEKHPPFMTRGIGELADFSAFGGESYDDLQGRVARLCDRWFGSHRASEDRVLVVAHGGINFQLVKALVCVPVPRVCIVRFGNCSATNIRLRERRGTYMGEVVWHLPVELMGDVSARDGGELFR
jgi:broad specificity phosphatase PhoE